MILIIVLYESKVFALFENQPIGLEIDCAISY